MDNVTVNVQLLGKDYLIACKSHEKDALLESARLLNEKMREIKGSGKVVGNEKISIMAALNIAHELLESKSQDRERANALRSRLQGLQERIGVAIDSHSQLQM